MLVEHTDTIDVVCNVCGQIIKTISQDQVPYRGPQTHERCRDPNHGEDK